MVTLEEKRTEWAKHLNHLKAFISATETLIAGLTAELSALKEKLAQAAPVPPKKKKLVEVEE